MSNNQINQKDIFLGKKIFNIYIMNYIYINSGDLSSGTIENGDYILHNAIENKNYIKLLNFHCTNTFYNVNANNNNLTFFDTSATTTYNITITEGNYDISSLIFTIETELNNSASSLVFNVTYNTNTMKVTISASGGFALYFNADNQINKLIGFSSNATSSDTTHTGENVVDLNYPKNILLTIREFGIEYNNSNNNNINLHTYNIPVNVNGSDIITYNEKYMFKQMANIKEKTIKRLNIVLRDENGNQLDLNGGNYQIIFYVI